VDGRGVFGGGGGVLDDGGDISVVLRAHSADGRASRNWCVGAGLQLQVMSDDKHGM